MSKTADEILAYNNALSKEYTAIAHLLAQIISNELPDAENKIWHRHPVWFLDGNPIVGYSLLKNGIRLMFWSGQSFEEDQLHLRGGKFKDAAITYTDVSQIIANDVQRWLHKSRIIQWDYKNIIKRKGVLERLK